MKTAIEMMKEVNNNGGGYIVKTMEELDEILKSDEVVSYVNEDWWGFGIFDYYRVTLTDGKTYTIQYSPNNDEE